MDIPHRAAVKDAQPRPRGTPSPLTLICANAKKNKRKKKKQLRAYFTSDLEGYLSDLDVFLFSCKGRQGKVGGGPVTARSSEAAPAVSDGSLCSEVALRSGGEWE